MNLLCYTRLIQSFRVGTNITNCLIWRMDRRVIYSIPPGSIHWPLLGISSHKTISVRQPGLPPFFLFNLETKEMKQLGSLYWNLIPHGGVADESRWILLFSFFGSRFSGFVWSPSILSDPCCEKPIRAPTESIHSMRAIRVTSEANIPFLPITFSVVVGDPEWPSSFKICDALSPCSCRFWLYRFQERQSYHDMIPLLFFIFSFILLSSSRWLVVNCRNVWFRFPTARIPQTKL